MIGSYNYASHIADHMEEIRQHQAIKENKRKKPFPFYTKQSSFYLLVLVHRPKWYCGLARHLRI
jgi:hypothetical protein